MAEKPLTELSDVELADLLVKAHRDRKLAEYQDGMAAYDRAVHEAERLRRQVLQEVKNRLAAVFATRTLADICDEMARELDAQCRSEA
jgi:predicted transcriptional regulator of viral defense system